MKASSSVVRLFLSFFYREKYKTLALIIMIIIQGAIPSIDSMLLEKITDLIEAFSDDQISNLPAIMSIWATLYALWWFGQNLLNRAYDYVYLKALPAVKASVLDEFYGYVQHHRHGFFQSNLAGHITNRITEGARSIELIFAYLNEKILRKIAIISFSLITMYTVHHILANIFLVWICLFMGLSLFFAKTINRYSTIYAFNKATVAGKIVDSIMNISAVRMFTSHKFERDYLRKYIGISKDSDQAMQWFMFKLRFVLGTLCSAMIFAIVYYLIILRSQLVISIGECVLIITLCLNVVEDTWDLSQEIGDTFEEIGAFTQTASLLEAHAIVDAANAKNLEVTNGEIEFKNVTFQYYNNDNLFTDKSIKIKPKQKVGLVGFSGSGKTTFVNLIIRLFDVSKGGIFIDGQDIKEVTQDSLRENISIIPQEPILFHRSIMENIRYGRKDATDEEVMEAAKAAYIHDFISKLPDGYNALCGERGNILSGGQKQRIIIARAILKNAPILILDEATSSLDSNTESLIQKSLEFLMNGKTVIVVAHRLSTLLNMDRILVFDKGRIIEEGSHEELLKKGSLYKRLWQLQTNELVDDLSTPNLISNS